MVKRMKLFVGGLMLSLFIASGAAAQEPGWSWQVIAVGPLREQIESTPIHQRPYRPLHFYGNTVRRQYYRGSAVPAPTTYIPGRWGRRAAR
jgi:hypothetical protein